MSAKAVPRSRNDIPVTSAFVSYAHEDREFALEVIKHLQAQGLEIRYDQVALHIGDSLIRAISREIADGDFLIALVSPDSVVSEWCQKEVALAMTEGINNRRVKVLPVGFRGAVMPPMLKDTYWADADRDDIETVARRLSASMEAHLRGRDDEATRDAESVERTDEAPAHAEVIGDVEVAKIDAVAQLVWDVFSTWERIWGDGGNIREISDVQRRLRWELGALPERIRVALPLVELIATAKWDEFFSSVEIEVAEKDVREELESVRAQVAQGLPVPRRWIIDGGLRNSVTRPDGRDGDLFVWQIRRGDEIRKICVFVSGTAMAVANDHLPREVVTAKETEGRSVVAMLASLEDPPKEVMVSTAGVSLNRA